MPSHTFTFTQACKRLFLSSVSLSWRPRRCEKCCPGISSKWFAHGWGCQCHTTSRWNRECLGLTKGIFGLKMGNKRITEPFCLLFILLTAICRSCACCACRETVAVWEMGCTTGLAWLFLFQRRWDEQGGGSSPVKASGVVLLSGLILSLRMYLNLQKARC